MHVYIQLLQNEKFNLKKTTLSNEAIVYKEEKQITGAYDWKGPLGERKSLRNGLRKSAGRAGKVLCPDDDSDHLIYIYVCQN